MNHGFRCKRGQQHAAVKKQIDASHTNHIFVVTSARKKPSNENLKDAQTSVSQTRYQKIFKVTMVQNPFQIPSALLLQEIITKTEKQ